jgi:hypothetical protein
MIVTIDQVQSKLWKRYMYMILTVVYKARLRDEAFGWAFLLQPRGTYTTEYTY